ncbi:hypothetical protein FSARC_11109 [Fusarium sarcochroum]|uniref:Uncharacterized protein n=1 Tax=Fusarium sarcochroum TaxID=1208366 RepID=A0A8H4THP6_9HYPO|nr:hypothetical protein FSARC_11109 [Fusarium sarcochroum]
MQTPQGQGICPSLAFSKYLVQSSQAHNHSSDLTPNVIKCDEIKPVCSNCRRRYIDIQSCDWDGQKQARLISSRDPRGAIVNQHPVAGHLHPCAILETDSHQLRTLELRLMYHYVTAVSHDMPACMGTGHAWQSVIPRLSFESELVLNPLLALSALHLHGYAPEDTIVAMAVRWYLDRALKNYRQALSAGNVSSEKLWLVSLVLANLQWLLSHQEQPGTSYELPLQAYDMLQGVTILFAKDQVVLKQLGYDWVGNGTTAYIPSPVENESLLVARAQLNSIDWELAQLLEAFEASNMPGDQRNIYMHAKDYVVYCYRLFYSGASAQTLRPLVGFMALNCHPEYREMLGRHDPLAMAMWARALVLLSQIDYSWWINGMGDYDVLKRDIRGIYSLMPAKLRWTMNWPCAVLEGDIIV